MLGVRIWVKPALLAVLAALFFLLPDAKTASATQSFTVDLRILSVDPVTTAANGNVSRLVAVLAGHHLPAKETITIDPFWDFASTVPVGDTVGTVNAFVDTVICDGTTEFLTANIINQATQGAEKVRWRAVLNGDLAFDFVITGDVFSGHTMEVDLFLDSQYCAPLDLFIAHWGTASPSGQPVLINPPVQNFYTWSASYESAPLANPPQHISADSQPVPIGPDGDSDLVPNFADNCPSDWNLLQEDLDGDGLGDVCDDDADGDGWTGIAEAFIGTSDLNACTDIGWPPDPAPVPLGNGSVQIDDVTFVASAFGSTTTPRAEIASQNGTVQIDDVTAFASRFGTSC